MSAYPNVDAFLEAEAGTEAAGSRVSTFVTQPDTALALALATLTRGLARMSPCCRQCDQPGSASRRGCSASHIAVAVWSAVKN